jgi:hypothetical protein
MSFHINNKIIYSDPEIEKIISIEGNNRCVDCGSDDPQWASLNNSVFVCLNCASIHRGLGKEISNIRSLVMDSWDDRQLKQLFLGGNTRFISNLEDYGIVKNNNHLSLNPEKIEKKYLYLASEYYRQLLHAELNLSDLPEKPDALSGCELIISKDFFENQTNSMYPLEQDINSYNEDQSNEESQKDTKEKKSIKDKISGFFSSAAKETKKTYNKLEEKVSQMQIKDKLKQTGEKTVVLAKDTGKFISSKATQVKVSCICILILIYFFNFNLILEFGVCSESF